MIETVIVAAYLIIMIGIGLWSRRKARRADDFFVAGRKGSTLYVTGSLLATIIGASATLGMAGLGFTQGLTGAWWLLVGTAGLIVLGVFFAKKVRAFGLYTLPQMAGKMYDGRVAFAASVFIVIAWMGVIAAQVIATGQVMSVLGIGSPKLWIVVCTVVFITYTLLGGQYSVLRTDFVQMIIVFIGIAGGLTVLLLHIGGFGTLVAALPSGRLSFPTGPQFGGMDLVSMLLLVGATYIVGPDMYSRLFCARDEKTARRSALISAAFLVPFAFGITLIGMGAAVIAPGITADQSFPTVISRVYPPVVSGIVLAALLSAVMSSAVTCLLSASTILNVDIIQRFTPDWKERKLLLSSRLAIVVLGLLAMFLALYRQNIISTIMWSYTIFTTGVILPIAAGFFKDRLKLTSNGALAAVVGGGLGGVLSKLVAVKYLDLWSLALAAVLLFGVSLAENRIRSRKTVPRYYSSNT